MRVVPEGQDSLGYRHLSDLNAKGVEDEVAYDPPDRPLVIVEWEGVTLDRLDSSRSQ